MPRLLGLIPKLCRDVNFSGFKGENHLIVAKLDRFVEHMLTRLVNQTIARMMDTPTDVKLGWDSQGSQARNSDKVNRIV